MIRSFHFNHLNMKKIDTIILIVLVHNVPAEKKWNKKNIICMKSQSNRQAIIQFL